MKIKVKYEVITLRGKVKKITKTHDCPDFKEYERTNSFILNGEPTTIKQKVTIENQINNWLDKLDKFDFICEEDLQGIVDWKLLEIMSIKDVSTINTFKFNKHDQIMHFAKSTFSDEDMLNDFFAIYQAMKPTISKLSVSNQFRIVLDALLVAAKSATVASEKMADIISGRSKNKTEKRNILNEYKDFLNGNDET